LVVQILPIRIRVLLGNIAHFLQVLELAALGFPHSLEAQCHRRLPEINTIHTLHVHPLAMVRDIQMRNEGP
jgi:hypothetical protein